MVRWLGAFSNQGFGRMSFLLSLLFHFVKFGPHYTLLENNILENILFACVIFIIPLCLFTTWVNQNFLEEKVSVFLTRTSIHVPLSLPIYNHFYLGRKYHSWKSSVVFWENMPACISLFLESVVDARKNCQDYEYVASGPWHQTLVCYGSVNMSCRLVFIFLKQK